MSENQKSEGGLAAALRPVVLVLLACVAAFYGLKLTVWLFKTLLLVAAVGTVGYVGYSLVRGKLGSEKTPAPQVTAEQSSPLAAEDSGAADVEEALRELKELQRSRDE